MPCVACWLIPLDKCPRLCLIGIGDVPCCIVVEAILFSIGNDVVSAAASLQTCPCAAWTYACCWIWGCGSCYEGPVIHNTYGAPVRLYVVGVGEILSIEDTTQGIQQCMWPLIAISYMLPHLKLVKSGLLVMLLLWVSFPPCWTDMVAPFLCF